MLSDRLLHQSINDLLHSRSGGRPVASRDTPVMSGSRWAMPLWQSMQVASPVASELGMHVRGLGDCSVKSM
jgi:hypothetical protein